MMQDEVLTIDNRDVESEVLVNTSNNADEYSEFILQNEERKSKLQQEAPQIDILKK